MQAKILTQQFFNKFKILENRTGLKKTSVANSLIKHEQEAEMELTGLEMSKRYRGWNRSLTAVLFDGGD